jgi:hypothetical protein
VSRTIDDGIRSRPPAERLAWKVQTFGDDAPLDIEEVAVFFGVGYELAVMIAAELPSARLSRKHDRWRYGDVRTHIRRLTEASRDL